MIKKILILMLLVTLTGSYKVKVKAASYFDMTVGLLAEEECQVEITGWDPVLDPITANVGQKLTFYVSYYANPDATYKVFKGTTNITNVARYNIKKENNKVYVHIKSVEYKDKGTYTIVLANKHGEDQATFKVEVNEGD